MFKLKYAITKGFQIFFTHISTGFLSILTVTTLLFFYLTVFTVNYSASKAIDKLTDIKTIRIFLEEGVDEKTMIKRLSELQMPASFKFYDKQSAKARVLRLVPGAKNIEKLPVELFPSFVEMTFADYASEDSLIAETASNIKTIGGVRTVEYGKVVGDKLARVKSTSNIFMIVISVLTGFAAAVIVFNTSKLTLYKQQKKIAIYKLVGATNGFITVPYIFAVVLESALAFTFAAIGNIMFIKGVTLYLLKNSYFVLFTPPLYLNFVFFALLAFTSIISVFFCVSGFLSGLKNINEA